MANRSLGTALAGVALIAVVTSVAYAPSLRGGFILDDDMYITHNPLTQAGDGPYKFWFTTEPIDYWPVFNTALWLEWRLWGMHGAGYRVTNLVLHIVSAVLIWVILLRLSIPGAFLAALLFAVHPVNVESVAWISQLKNLLALLFSLLSILCYLHTLSGAWYALSLVTFALAMLSKGSVAVLPALLLGIVCWLRPLTRHDLMRVAPFFLIAAVLVPVNVWFQSRTVETDFPTVDPLQRLLGAAAAVWFYLSKALIPVDLTFIYPRWQVRADRLVWWVPLLAAVAVTALLWRSRRGWGRPLLFAWGFYCLSLVPVLGFADVGFLRHSLVADHYQHLALIGVVTLVAAGWDTWRQRLRGRAAWAPIAAAIAAVGLLTLLTWRQSRLYASPADLYRHTVERNPDAWIAHNNLGVILATTGRADEAIRHLQQAVQLKPDYLDAHNNLGNALAAVGQRAAAIEHYQHALRLGAAYADTHYNLGLALVDAGRLQDGIEHYRQALQLQPDFVNAHYNLGLALLKAGQSTDAIEAFRRALALRADYAEAHNDLGVALVGTGELDEAVGHFREALRLDPNLPDAQINLELAVAMQRQTQ